MRFHTSFWFLINFTKFFLINLIFTIFNQFYHTLLSTKLFGMYNGCTKYLYIVHIVSFICWLIKSKYIIHKISCDLVTFSYAPQPVFQIILIVLMTISVFLLKNEFETRNHRRLWSFDRRKERRGFDEIATRASKERCVGLARKWSGTIERFQVFVCSRPQSRLAKKRV